MCLNVTCSMWDKLDALFKNDLVNMNIILVRKKLEIFSTIIFVKLGMSSKMFKYSLLNI